jgi:tetratricopeptide (TPR) repeat protein
VLVAGLGLLLAGGCSSGDEASLAAAPASAPAMWTLSTTSDAARQAFTEAEDLFDVGRPAPEVYAKYQEAIAADANFAFAHLRASQLGPVLAENRAHLRRAVELSAGASEMERLLIQIQQKAVEENDAEGALVLARQLTQMFPDNPRAWLEQSGREEAVSRVAESRASLDRALELAPDYIATELTLLNSYALVPPIDPVRAEQHGRRAVELAPSEPFPYVRLAYTLRAQNRLADAEAQLTRAVELDPTVPASLAQRAHVRLFMGNFAGARADYDAAIELQDANGKPGVMIQRALVDVHEGNPAAAIAALEQLYGTVDGMGVSDPSGPKINASLAQLFIGAHTGDFAAADAALGRLRTLWRARADQVGTDVYRRAREADIAFQEGLLAVYKRDFALAERKASEITSLVESVQNPRRNEPALILRGLGSLAQGRHAEAAQSFEQTFSTYIRDGGNFSLETYLFYQQGLALEGAGRSSDAQQFFRRAAENTFTTVGAALVRKDAQAKTAG